MAAPADFVGPLDAATQAWSDRVLAVDRTAALAEPVEVVIRRRQISIAEFHSAAAALLLTGQSRAAYQISLGAVAEARALAEFTNRPPAPASDCVDCIVNGHPCPMHASHSRSATQRAGPQDVGEPSWHRFGR